MASSSSIPSLFPPLIIPSSFKPKPCHFLNAQCMLSNTLPSGKGLSFHIIPQKRTKFWRNSATGAGEALPTGSTPVESTQEMVSSIGDDGSATIISVLFFLAFLVLSLLTLGVIYIGVTDFLQKREREKFEKEEAAGKKKGGKNVKARARAGPRGFGQKSDEYNDDD